MNTTTFSLPGKAVRVICTGNFQRDSPQAFADVVNAKRVLYGRAGSSHRISTTRERAIEILDYLDSVAGCLATMTPEERGADGWSEMRACQESVRRIQRVTNS